MSFWDTFDSAAFGQSEKFGAADYAAALKGGQTKKQIRDYVADQGLEWGGDTESWAAKGSGLTTKLGLGGPKGMSTAESQKYFGGVDEIHARQTLAEEGITGTAADLKISDFLKEQGVGALNIAAASAGGDPNYQKMIKDIGLGASAQRTENLQIAENKAMSDWRKDESAARAREAEKKYNALVAAQERQAEEARKNALKVKYQGTTAVSPGQSAMGIKFAQSPAFASGAASRGTAQLARSDKGTKLTNLNIA